MGFGGCCSPIALGPAGGASARSERLIGSPRGEPCAPTREEGARAHLAYPREHAACGDTHKTPLAERGVRGLRKRGVWKGLELGVLNALLLLVDSAESDVRLLKADRGLKIESIAREGSGELHALR